MNRLESRAQDTDLRIRVEHGLGDGEGEAIEIMGPIGNQIRDPAHVRVKKATRGSLSTVVELRSDDRSTPSDQFSVHADARNT